MFIDETRITLQGGVGGNGCFSFRREKFVPNGGPDGGDGGHGGSVLLEADEGVSTLLAFRYRRFFHGERGRHGQGSNKTGRSGQDLVLRVPVGTVVLDEDGLLQLADLDRPGACYMASEGGRGGRGNARFNSSVNQAPTRHEPGAEPEEIVVRLELKLLADVGLVGFPNAGKSTLISRISAARPRIADYPFTTLEPNLGVVDRGEHGSMVVADIPGLIEGAHRGAGLGLRFLRHVERCRLLLHLVDPTAAGEDAVSRIEAIDRELALYDERMAAKPQILVITKSDASQDPEPESRIREFARQSGRSVYRISAVTGEGLDALVYEVGQQLDAIPVEPLFDPDAVDTSDEDEDKVTPVHRTSVKPLEAPPSDAPEERKAPPSTVAVLGGTFDPVHCGHVALAETARNELGVETLLLVPAAIPPHKSPARRTAAAHREAMLRLAVRGIPGLEVSTLELDTGEVRYTIDTLRRLRAAPSGLRPVFVLGMDGLVDLPTWRNWTELIAEFDLAAVDRPGCTLGSHRDRLDPAVLARLMPAGTLPEDLGSGGRILHVAMTPVDASSREIRAALADGEPIDRLVPPSVARYIQEHGLYAAEDER